MDAGAAARVALSAEGDGDFNDQGSRVLRGLPAIVGHNISQPNPSPLRRILPADGEGKCAVQHNVSVSQ